MFLSTWSRYKAPGHQVQGTRTPGTRHQDTRYKAPGHQVQGTRTPGTGVNLEIEYRLFRAFGLFLSRPQTADFDFVLLELPPNRRAGQVDV